ncbi:chymotrypsin-elastase inhibitor ixodidin-like [Rana temporaria]|uniref:chymotrypsin-elastase inhibitor ixodidin-like n=1 Tax=Rana temporaria TaxID=8407 RepID=UPI001AADEDAE|nr:chymotrypsin-elastase inhibitor ixodidin-like [Rana temporaria]
MTRRTVSGGSEKMLRMCATFLLILVLNALLVQGHRIHPGKRCPSPYQVWKECGSACPRNCHNIDYPSPFCGLVCESGCFCRHPFMFLNEKSRICVLRKQCKQINAHARP